MMGTYSEVPLESLKLEANHPANQFGAWRQVYSRYTTKVIATQVRCYVEAISKTQSRTVDDRTKITLVARHHANCI